METIIFSLNEIDKAAELIQKGELVAFPTETVYGLGADALNPTAVLKIFEAKGRPADNPLIVHVKEAKDVLDIAYVTDDFHKLAKNFWPGPLTMVLPRKPVVPDITTGNLDTVAVRCPDNQIAIELIDRAKTPIAAPSANRSGRPSPTEAKHVLEDMNGVIKGIVDGGHTGIGLESTVLDLSSGKPTILRPGGITIEMLKEVLEDVDVAKHKPGEKVRSPGLKYRHYAPKAPLYLVTGTPKEQYMMIQKQIQDRQRNIGVLATSEFFPLYDVQNKVSLGSRDNLVAIAANLYGALRFFDSTEVEFILAETVTGDGLAVAINDRLFRASGGKTYKEFLQDIRY